MNITIIGAGNMGGAIAQGLATQIGKTVKQLSVVNRSTGKLTKLKSQFNNIRIDQSHQEAVDESNIVIIAVKPWLVEEVMNSLIFNDNHIIISVASGITCDQILELCHPATTVFRIIPNTAISEKASMNIISSINASTQQEEQVDALFKPLGYNMFIPEDKMAPATAIASCGIAYLFKYIQACMQAGVEAGLTPNEAKTLAAQAAIGAGTVLINQPNSHPSTEIDKVTTPGGITIKGINTLEKGNFTHTIIEAIKKSQ